MNNFDFLPDNIQITVDLYESDIFSFTEIRTVTMSKSDFIRFINENHACIASNGVIYHNKIKGLIPSILDDWFNERLRYKQELKKFETNSDEYQYYDRKQLITKILLNSFYGVLLLPSFRFYDKLNGEGVTLSGQDIIKFSGSTVNNFYEKRKGIERDNVVYSDTDSMYIEALPLLDGHEQYSDLDVYQIISNVSNEVCQYINDMLKVFSAKHFNSTNSRLKFAQEKIAKRLFFGDAKKRYAQLTVDDNLNEKVEVKGLDMVRSSFPQTFRTFQKKLIEEILHDVPVKELNLKIKEYKEFFKTEPLINIMLPTSVKELSKFKHGQKGTPVHVKSAQNYNKLLELFKVDSSPKFEDGDKILWAYLKNNPYGFETIALRGYEDPQPIVEFVERFIHKEEIFNRSFLSKIETIWNALGWGKVDISDENEFF